MTDPDGRQHLRRSPLQDGYHSSSVSRQHVQSQKETLGAMPNTISAFETDLLSFIDLPGYAFQVTSVPFGISATSSVRHDFDDRSIDLPIDLGSIWVRVYLEADATAFIARAVFAVGSKAVVCDGVHVDEAHRQMGIASRCYDIAGMIAGTNVQPSSNQTTDAKLFWRNRDSR